eukprot:TRINITY_DN664_c0_g1_i7.p1 TRINITY_DN664_c0_g1~~TRINITY_DN664_c0_g1_i7.p1  ORF type:complete len:835 (-),score=47.67 TRINITY_DN664_c0_g1_i7:157-2661(-)
MSLQATSNTNKLAVLSNIAYECLQSSESQGTSRDRVISALTIAKSEFKNIGLETLDFHSSNQDMFAVVNKSTKEVFVIYRGTTLPTIRDLGNDLAIAVSDRPGSWRMNTAQKFANDVAKQLPGYTVTTSGHSLGGAIAEHVAYLNGYKCESFNAGFAFTSLKQIAKSTYEGITDGLSRIMGAILPFYKHRDHVRENQKLDENIISHHVNWDLISSGKHLGRRNDILSGNPLTAHSMKNFIEKVKEYDAKVVGNQLKVGENSPSLGGVDLSIPGMLSNPAFKNIKGILFKGQNSYFQITKGTFKEVGVPIGILATALLVYYDPSIRHKSLRFSLGPYDPKNLEGDYEVKHTWPDEAEKRNIIGNTIIGKIMFEADYLMKQMSLGVTDTKAPFAYPPHLKAKGLCPSHEFATSKAINESKWCRFWLEVKSLRACETSDAFLVNHIEMCVKARQMMVNSKHELEDAEVQDVNDESYKFASVFTKLYEDIANEYPIFTELKQVALANAIASWCWEKRVPIDVAKLKAIYNAQVVSDWKNIVRTIKNTTTTVTQNGNVITTHKRAVMGGVNMSSLFDVYINTVTGCQETRFAKTVAIVEHVTDPGVSVRNPLIEIRRCAIYNNCVEQEALKVPAEGKAYCINHHPLKCGACDKLVEDKYKVISDVPYHPTCSICCACLYPIEDKYMKLQFHEIHITCKELMEAKLKARYSKEISTMPVSSSRKDEYRGTEDDLKLALELSLLDSEKVQPKREDYYETDEEEKILKQVIELSLLDKKSAKPVKENTTDYHLENEKVNILKTSFPGIPKETLICILREMGGDIINALDLLNNQQHGVIIWI